jgi:hypothetical protein
MTMVLFSQDIGAATWLVAANAIFNNGLKKELEKRVSEIRVDPSIIVEMGATSLRQLITGDRLVAALECYVEAVRQVMYLGIGLCLATFVFGMGLGWKDIRVEKKLQAIKIGSSSKSSVVLGPRKRNDTEKEVEV